MSSDLHSIPVTEVCVPRCGLYIPPPDSPEEKRVYRMLIEVSEAARQAVAADRADEAERPLREVADLLDPARRQSVPLARPEPVELTEPGFAVRVLGKPKRLTATQHKVIRFLLSKGAGGANKSDLQGVTTDAVKVLGRLRDSDSDWAQVIQMAGGPGRGYRIVRPD